jgi:hypothetical protein
MKRIAALAIILMSSSTLAAAQQPSSWTSGLHHIKMSISSTATKSVNGMKSLMHLDAKRTK